MYVICSRALILTLTLLLTSFKSLCGFIDFKCGFKCGLRFQPPHCAPFQRSTLHLRHLLFEVGLGLANQYLTSLCTSIVDIPSSHVHMNTDLPSKQR